MKKKILLIILGCLGNYFASGTFTGSFTDSLPGTNTSTEQLQNKGIRRSISRLNAFLGSLETCKTALSILIITDINSEILEGAQRHIGGIITHIDNIREKIASIMPALREAESMGNFETGNCFESINFDTLLDGFIRIENTALQWLKTHKGSLGEESYNRIKHAIKISLEVALRLKLVTIVGTGVEVFSCNRCCLLF
jgi:hypothetical protein